MHACRGQRLISDIFLHSYSTCFQDKVLKTNASIHSSLWEWWHSLPGVFIITKIFRYFLIWCLIFNFTLTSEKKNMIILTCDNYYILLYYKQSHSWEIFPHICDCSRCFFVILERWWVCGNAWECGSLYWWVGLAELSNNPYKGSMSEDVNSSVNFDSFVFCKLYISSIVFYYFSFVFFKMFLKQLIISQGKLISKSV